MNDKEINIELKKLYLKLIHKEDLGYLWDVFVSAGVEFSEENFQEKAEKVIMDLPDHIFGKIISWGLSDTVVRDSIHELIEDGELTLQ